MICQYLSGCNLHLVEVLTLSQKNGESAFSTEDEESFRVFAVYCGLALHHAKLYDKIRRSEQKYKVALEVLSYHSGATQEECENIKQIAGENNRADSLQNELAL